MDKHELIAIVERAIKQVEQVPDNVYYGRAWRFAGPNNNIYG